VRRVFLSLWRRNVKLWKKDATPRVKVVFPGLSLRKGALFMWWQLKGCLSGRFDWYLSFTGLFCVLWNQWRLVCLFANDSYWRMRNLLTQALLAIITGESGTG
jgi:hypothetical protein